MLDQRCPDITLATLNQRKDTGVDAATRNCRVNRFGNDLARARMRAVAFHDNRAAGC